VKLRTLLNYYNEGGSGGCSSNLTGDCTAAVGSHPEGTSPCGVMDMAGNVYEWVADGAVGDYYSYYEPDVWPANPIAGEEVNDSVKLIRGGGWVSNDMNVLMSHRSYSGIDGYGNAIGFRGVRSP